MYLHFVDYLNYLNNCEEIPFNGLTEILSVAIIRMCASSLFGSISEPYIN